MAGFDLVLFCVFVAVGGIRGWWQSLWARMRGTTEALESRRAQERQQAHELRMLREGHRHEQHMAGQGFPTFGESVGAGLGKRFANGPLPYDQRHPLRRWWWDRCADWADQDELRRHEHARRAADGEWWWQRGGAAARRRARRYWDDVQARREEKRRQADIPDAEWWEDPPQAPPSAPSTPSPEPPPHPAPSAEPRQDTRPGPVQATAERVYPAPPQYSGPAAEISTRQDPTQALEAGDEGEDAMSVSSALVPTSRAVARDARSAARHHPAATLARQSVGQQLAQVVGGYSAAEVNDAVALMAAWMVAVRDCADELYRDLQNQRVRGQGMQRLHDAADDVSDAVTALHQAKGHFEYHERLLEDIAEIQQRSGLGNVTSYSGGQIH